MSLLDPLAHRYQLASIHQGRVQDRHLGMHLLHRPVPGARLVMYGGDGRRRIVTSRITRTYHLPNVDGTFVETGNSLYLLQLESLPVSSGRIQAAMVHPA